MPQDCFRSSISYGSAQLVESHHIQLKYSNNATTSCTPTKTAVRLFHCHCRWQWTEQPSQLYCYWPTSILISFFHATLLTVLQEVGTHCNGSLPAINKIGGISTEDWIQDSKKTFHRKNKNSTLNSALHWKGNVAAYWKQQHFHTNVSRLPFNATTLHLLRSQGATCWVNAQMCQQLSSKTRKHAQMIVSPVTPIHQLFGRTI